MTYKITYFSIVFIAIGITSWLPAKQTQKTFEFENCRPCMINDSLTNVHNLGMLQMNQDSAWYLYEIKTDSVVAP